MSLESQVRAASSSRAALILIAAAIDKLAAAPVPPSDTWNDWVPDDHGFAPQEQTTPNGDNDDRSSSDYTAKVNELQTLINNSTGEDRLSHEARLRLLKEEYTKPIPQGVPEGRRITVSADDTAILIDLPPASVEREAERRHWATVIKLGDMLDLDADEAVDAFTKGGPMWLYTYDRDAVMQMPVDWRAALIEDIQQDSPAQAQEVARDILKDETPGNREVSLETVTA